MSEIFGNTHQSTGINMITAHSMIMSVSGGAAAGTGKSLSGALVQNVVIQFSQPVQTVREIGSKDFYLFAQPPQGTLSISRLVASDRTIIDIFPETDEATSVFADPQAVGNKAFPTITLSSIRNDGGSKVTYLMTSCIAESIGASTNAEGAFIQESLSIRFGALSFDNSASAVAGNSAGA